MSKQIQLEDFIPPLFDLKKYDSLASSSTQEWLTNIVARLPAYYDIESYSKILESGGTDKSGQSVPNVYGKNHDEVPNKTSIINLYASEDLVPEGYSILKHHQESQNNVVAFEYPSILSGDVEENIRCGSNRVLMVESPTFQHILGLFCLNDKIESLSVSNIISLASSIRGNPKLREQFSTININNSDISSIDAIIRTISLTPEEDELDSGDEEFIPRAEFDKWREISNSSASLFTDRWLQDKNELDYVQVDLSLPDHVLSEQFSNWLAEQRKAGRNTYNHNKKYLTKAKMRLWFDSRVIPYMDVLQWNERQGRTIPHAIAGRIIFSDMSKNDFRNPAGIIADTTLKHMKEITSRRTLILLSAQVISEVGSKF